MGRFFLLLISFSVTSCQRTPAFWSDQGFVSKDSSSAWVPSSKSVKQASHVHASLKEYLPEIRDSMSIVDAFDIALMNSPETRVAYAESKIAAQNLAISESELFPKLELTGNYTKDQTGTMVFGRVFTQKGTYYGGGLNLSYLIFQFGNRIAAIEESAQALSFVNWQYNQTIQNVLIRVADNYFDYLFQKAYLDAVKEDLLDSEVYLLAAEEKFNAGVINCTQVQEAKTQYFQQEVQYHNQKKAVKVRYLEFKKSMGVAKEMDYRFPTLEEGKDKLLSINLESIDLIEVGKKNRPSYQSYKADVLAKEASLDKAETDGYPAFNVSGASQPQWTDAHDKIHNYELNFTVSFPVFAGFFYMNNIKKSKAALERSRERLNREEVELTNDLLEYKESFVIAQKQVYYTYKYLQSSKIEKESAWKAFLAGTEDFLHVSSALASYADAKAQYLDSLKKLYTSYFELLYGMGTLSLSNEEVNDA